MKPASFDYFAPDSLDQAVQLLARHGEDAKLLAGGQSLVPAMNFRVVQPSVLIDLNRIPELAFIRREERALRVGAMVRERQLELDPLVASCVPLLAEAMPYVAHPQIRNRGTLGGSLAHADPAAELPVIMAALAARFKASGPKGERWLNATEFFLGLFTTALSPDEILEEVEIPLMPERTGWSFLEVAPRAGDYALMGVAAMLTLDGRSVCQEAKLVYLNAGEGPMEAPAAAKLLKGESIDERLMESAAATASETEIQPFGNVHASAAFQRHLARVLTRKALVQALERAQERLP